MKGVATFALAMLLAAPAMARPVIAITVDDLPSHAPLPTGMTRTGIARDMIEALKAGGAGRVSGFVNGAATGSEPESAPVLRLWQEAGLPLGNHGWSHLDLDKVGAPAFIADIARNESVLRETAGQGDWHWFRFPFLHEGKDAAARLAVRKALAEKGYRIAGVTMSFNDFLWNDAYHRCVATKDEAAIAWMESSYLTAARDAAERSRAEARAVYGRDIPYVLLMHVGAFSARMMPRLLAQYRQTGFDFTDLATAERDPAYAADVDPSLPPEAALDARANAAGVAPSAGFDASAALAALCKAAPAPR